MKLRHVYLLALPFALFAAACTPEQATQFLSAVRAESGGPLSWAPPALSSPSTVVVKPSGGSYKLADRDYVVQFPDTPVTDQVRIDGGRNVVVTGGEIRMSHSNQGALVLKDWKGTMHVEGLEIDPGGNRGIENDAIRVDNDMPGAVAQLQNLYVHKVAGSVDGLHGDILQSWRGPSLLRVDRMTGHTTYQGFWFQPLLFDDVDLQRWDFRNVDLHKHDAKGWVLYGMSKAGNPPIPTCTNVWADQGSTGRWSEQADREEMVACGVRNGAPPKSYVDPGTVGIGYVSPGYA